MRICASTPCVFCSGSLDSSSVTERINLQRDDGQAKPYQVRQVRHVILKYELKVNE